MPFMACLDILDIIWRPDIQVPVAMNYGIPSVDVGQDNVSNLINTRRVEFGPWVRLFKAYLDNWLDIWRPAMQGSVTITYDSDMPFVNVSHDNMSNVTNTRRVEFGP